MKKFLALLMCVLFVTGCAWVNPTNQNTRNQDKLTKAIQKVDVTKEELAKNDKQKLTETATYAFGIQYSLNQMTNSYPPIETALKLNSRVISIVGSPEINDMKKMIQIVDLLNSEISAEHIKGEKLLNAKDKEIAVLQQQNTDLKNQHDTEIKDLITKSKTIARKSDDAQATLDDMSGFMGLNAVWWGLKHFFVTSLTYILIFVVVFLLLRVFAASNPIVGTIFGFFEMIAGTFINLIKGLVPNSIDFSNLVHTDVHNKYKNTLEKIVDSIEELKRNAKAANKQYTLEEALISLDKIMDQEEKDCIKEILKNQKWN
jgi:hypothetical protein